MGSHPCPGPPLSGMAWAGWSPLYVLMHFCSLQLRVSLSHLSGPGNKAAHLTGNAAACRGLSTWGGYTGAREHAGCSYRL